MNNLITVAQALALRDLGYDEETIGRYAFDQGDKFYLQEGCAIYKNSISKSGISVPTVDETIDWLRRKYSIVIYNSTAPYVDTSTRVITYAFTVKLCNQRWGWNQRTHVGTTKWSKDIYAMKRIAIWMAIRYIKKQKHAKERRKNKVGRTGIRGNKGRQKHAIMRFLRH